MEPDAVRTAAGKCRRSESFCNDACLCFHGPHQILVMGPFLNMNRCWRDW